MKEMEDRLLPTNSSGVTASKIILEMRRSTTSASTLDFYHRYQSNLDELDYEAFLQAYCRLLFKGDLEAARYAARNVRLMAARISLSTRAKSLMLRHLSGMVICRDSEAEPRLFPFFFSSMNT